VDVIVDVVVVVVAVDDHVKVNVNEDQAALCWISRRRRPVHIPRRLQPEQVRVPAILR